MDTATDNNYRGQDGELKVVSRGLYEPHNLHNFHNHDDAKVTKVTEVMESPNGSGETPITINEQGEAQF